MIDKELEQLIDERLAAPLEVVKKRKKISLTIAITFISIGSIPLLTGLIYGICVLSVYQDYLLDDLMGYIFDDIIEYFLIVELILFILSSIFFKRYSTLKKRIKGIPIDLKKMFLYKNSNELYKYEDYRHDHFKNWHDLDEKKKIQQIDFYIGVNLLRKPLRFYLKETPKKERGVMRQQYNRSKLFYWF